MPTKNDKQKYIQLLPAHVKNSIVNIKLELSDLGDILSGSDDKTLVKLLNNAITAVNQLDEYAWKISG